VEAFFGLLAKYTELKNGNIEQLNRYRGPDQKPPKREKGRGGGRPPKTTARDDLFFTLFVLRTGNHLDVASRLFGISASRGTSTFVTFIDLMARVLMLEMPFPSQEQSRASVPKEWEAAFSCRVRIVLDCTNINLETHSDPDVQCTSYSKYYAGNCAKILIGTHPSGAIIFCSLAYPGRVSDNDITIATLLDNDLLDAEDDVMADKGFTIHDVLFLKLIGHIMPPKKSFGIDMFSALQAETGSKIANKRIHVERAMKRIKAFSYLKRTIPVTQFDILSHIVFVVAMLSNYQCPLKDSELSTFDEDGPNHIVESSDSSAPTTPPRTFSNSPVPCDLPRTNHSSSSSSSSSSSGGGSSSSNSSSNSSSSGKNERRQSPSKAQATAILASNHLQTPTTRPAVSPIRTSASTRTDSPVRLPRTQSSHCKRHLSPTKSQATAILQSSHFQSFKKARPDTV
jgi:uncharacterized membrane protein YgcG